jgi:hypothetical protein
MMKSKGTLLICLTLLMIYPAALVVDSKAPAPTQAKALPPAWVIEMSRDGGMRPRKESLSISSDGLVAVTSEHLSQGKTVIDCSLKEKLSAEDLSKLKEAVRSAKSQAWKNMYEDSEHSQCCDQPTSNLTLQQRGAKKSYSTSWYPGSSNLRPADLVKIAELAQAVWNKASEHCGN